MIMCDAEYTSYKGDEVHYIHGFHSLEDFLPSSLLLMVIIIAVVIVTIIRVVIFVLMELLVVIVVAIIGVVVVVMIIGIVVVFLLSLNFRFPGDPIGLFYSDGVRMHFHQNKASSLGNIATMLLCFPRQQKTIAMKNTDTVRSTSEWANTPSDALSRKQQASASRRQQYHYNHCPMQASSWLVLQMLMFSWEASICKTTLNKNLQVKSDGGVVDLIGDEDPTDEDEKSVSVSLVLKSSLEKRNLKNQTSLEAQQLVEDCGSALRPYLSRGYYGDKEGISLGPVFLLGLLAFVMAAACASRAAAIPLVISCRAAQSCCAARVDSDGGVVDLIGDEDPTDEDGDIGVSMSLGDEIFSEEKKSRESNIGGGTIAGRVIITWGGGIALLISESEGTIVEENHRSDNWLATDVPMWKEYTSYKGDEVHYIHGFHSLEDFLPSSLLLMVIIVAVVIVTVIWVVIFVDVIVGVVIVVVIIRVVVVVMIIGIVVVFLLSLNFRL
ncbi:hypothetical protein Tco_0053470 [Tanacetum coccineum]